VFAHLTRRSDMVDMRDFAPVICLHNALPTRERHVDMPVDDARTAYRRLDDWVPPLAGVSATGVTGCHVELESKA
jgi:hypothetical protein